MSQLSSFVSCPDLQDMLNTYITNCDPTRIREPLALQNVLYSEENRGGTQQVKVGELVSPGGGKVRKAQLVYSPRLLESSVDEGTGRDQCTASNIIGETSAEYTISENDYVQYGFQIPVFDLRERCQANELYVAEKIQQAIDAVLRKRESKFFTQVNLLNGKFASDFPDDVIITDDTLQVATKYDDGKFNPDMLETIGSASRYNAYCSNPVIIGGYNVGKYFRAVQAGCCSLDGINIADLSAQYGRAFVESYRADSIFGKDEFMTMALGAAQVLEYLEFEGPRGINMIDTEIYKQMVVTDPSTGARLDLKMNFDCGVWHIFVRSYAKVVALPSDVFYSGDRLSGVNFINRYKIVNP